MPDRARPSRQLTIAATVVALHVGALWALQSGLLRRAAEVFVPVEVIAALIEPAQPIVEPVPTPAAPVVPRPAPRAAPRPSPAPSPQPAPAANPEPAPNAPLVMQTPPGPPAPATTPAAMPTAAAAPSAPQTLPAAPAAAAPPRIELPSSNADYLNNPRPPYPPLSRRLGEQGQVMVRVFIETDGSASRGEIARSSGFERLDQTALQTVLRWRYVPGKRGGVPQAMWFNVPINFVLE